ncbi:2-dehydropantoate 2-reductase [Colwellia asteriadis]|uniref:2-dehydropantoate 2-reductase n=1 Tax=Colwellia asteriadis TaxID=517723 RepID=A0ABP3WIC9_9GAMM
MKNSLTASTHNLSKRIVVVGQGAIGLLYYHHFSQQNYQVSLQASTSISSSTTSYSFTAYNTTTEHNFLLQHTQTVDIQNADIILICVKSYQAAVVIEQLAPLIKPKSIIVLAHNGMGVYEEIKGYLPTTQPILALLTTHGCLRNKPLAITHTGIGKTDIGLLNGNLSLDTIEALTLLFNQAIPVAEYHHNINNKQWLKLAINCVINPITALHNIENGQVNQYKFTPLVTKILEEVIAVAKKEGVTFSFDKLFEVVHGVATATAKNSSSMRCDVIAKRVTEIAYINGYIHRLGEKHGIATVENTRLWQQITTLTDT